MRKLVAVFENSEGRNHRWSLKEPDTNKSAEEIKSLLEKMTTLDLFEKDGVKLFQKVVSAKFVETKETSIFDVKEKTDATEEPFQVEKKTVKEVDKTNEASVELEAEKELRIQIDEEAEDGIKQMEIIVPEDIDINALTEDELATMFASVLPDDAVLEDIYYEEVEESPKVEEDELDSEEAPPQKEKQASSQKKKYSKAKRKLLERFNRYKSK